MPARLRLPILLLMSLVLMTDLSSGESGQSELPGVDLLEFIGSYQDESGNWIDPAEMENINLPKEHANEQPTEQ